MVERSDNCALQMGAHGHDTVINREPADPQIRAGGTLDFVRGSSPAGAVLKSGSSTRPGDASVGHV